MQAGPSHSTHPPHPPTASSTSFTPQETATDTADAVGLDPNESYQVDSDAFSSDASSLDDEEYDALVDEADNGYTDEEVAGFHSELKESGLVSFLRSYLNTPDESGHRRSLRKLLLGFGVLPPKSLRDSNTPDLSLLPFAQVALARILRRRTKLPQYNTVDDAVSLLSSAKRIIVLSGAGISTSCGIPDFRSATGLYAQLEGQYELDDPHQMFDISYFRERPEVFYSFAKKIYPSNFVPSPCHRWIKMLEDRDILLRNYTQNIDTLESLAGVTRVLQCHGSFATASCLRCKRRMPGNEIETHIMSRTVPYCEPCREQRAYYLASKKKRRRREDSDDEDEDDDEWDGEPGIIKPDITFFGQALDSQFDECLFKDRDEVDLLVIIGTSLKVAPVSEVLSHIPHSVPQIFINLTPVTHVQPDISLLGDGDTIVQYLSHRLGWFIPPPPTRPSLASTPAVSPGEAPESLIAPGSSVKVSPEDVVWLTGTGEMSHVHVLSSKDAMAARLEGAGVDADVHVDAEDERGRGESAAVAEAETPVQAEAERDEKPIQAGAEDERAEACAKEEDDLNPQVDAASVSSIAGTTTTDSRDAKRVDIESKPQPNVIEARLDADVGPVLAVGTSVDDSASAAKRIKV